MSSLQLKVCQHQYEKKEREMDRKRNIERLKKINEISKKHRQQGTLIMTKLLSPSITMTYAVNIEIFYAHLRC